MPASNYREDLLEHLHESHVKFLDAVDELAQDSRLIELSPQSLTQGRSFAQIVHDDCLDVLETHTAFVVANSPELEEDDIPLDIYRTILERRTGGPVSPQDASARLQAALVVHHNSPRVMIHEMPDFMKVLLNARRSDKEYDKAVKRMESNWQAFVGSGALFYKNEVQMAAENINAIILSQFRTQMGMIGTNNVGFAKSNFENNAAAGANTGSVQADMARQTQAELMKDQKAYLSDKKIKILEKELAKERKNFKEITGKKDDEDLSLAERIEKAGLPPEALKKAKKILARLEKAQGAEAGAIESQLTFIADMPWNKRTALDNNITHTQDKLDADHYGLEKVKETIVEHVAVQSHTGQNSKTILCLVGPPGVGKTSIARSIAEATGRKYVRMALGGIDDEAEIRGHSSTYIGAKPGQIAQLMIKADAKNTLFLLDEVDKLGSNGMKGDPKAALLEVLDPEQNNSYRDKYLDVEFDLSEVMFVCTANYEEQIPPALADRMHIVRLPGYTHEEKMQIAKRYLVPKQMADKHLTNEQIVLTDGALAKTIHTHTREAGVRSLERAINALCRKEVVRIEKGNKEQLVVTEENVDDFLGPGHGTGGNISKENQVGVVNGLYYSATGGGILPIEVAKVPGKELSLTITGKFEEVMKNSANNARNAVRHIADRFNDAAVGKISVEETALSINAPGNQAVPTDGPSAGAAFATAIISAVTGIPIHSSVAMTGELGLNGQVLPIGGLREKLDGARREGIQTVLYPKANEKDLVDVPIAIRESMTLIAVSTLDEVLTHALDTSGFADGDKRKNQPVLINQRGWSPL